jgi:hypothetical protein
MAQNRLTNGVSCAVSRDVRPKALLEGLENPGVSAPENSLEGFGRLVDEAHPLFFWNTVRTIVFVGIFQNPPQRLVADSEIESQGAVVKEVGKTGVESR